LRVEVKAPARLHLGFITPVPVEGRGFGSIGIAVEEPATLVQAEPAEELVVEGLRAEDAERFASATLSWLGLRGAKVKVVKSPPVHVGLGSTTQLALSVAVAVAKAHGVDVDPVEAAKALGRGLRSGAGTYAFKHGGLVVDAGRGLNTEFPPLVFRCSLPSSWAFIVVLPRGRGLSGRVEHEAFRALKPKPRLAHRAAYAVLMKLLPAALEGDLEGFSSALTELQEAVGEMFSEAQGGAFAEHSANAVEALRSIGIKGVGQSSWGPAVYGLVHVGQAEDKLDEVRRVLKGCEAFIARPRNQGASISLVR